MGIEQEWGEIKKLKIRKYRRDNERRLIEMYRDDLILNYCKEKDVLHIGACNSPYHIERARRGALLHQKLQGVCKELIGIDIDRNAIEELKKLGVANIYPGDIIKNEYDIDLTNYKFDYIVAGEVIEHLENPGIALDNIKDLMNKDTKLILTTPNAFSYGVIKQLLTGEEKVHQDHVFWPSYKTLLRLFKYKNLKVEYFTYCMYGCFREVSTVNRIAYKLILKRKKHLMPGLFFVLSL